MLNQSDIKVPTLLIHKKTCLGNIRMMQKKADESGVQLIPHFKTHQSAGVGSWFRDSGTSAITVSSLTMASFFADHGWDDITVAFPVNLRETETINKLASKIRLRVFILSVDVAEKLASELANRIDFYIEIDTGYNRTGVSYKDYPLIEAILDRATSTDMLRFTGFYTHDGNTYDATGTDAILSIHTATRQKLIGLRQRYQPKYPGIKISMGDTPGCSLTKELDGMDEVRPGNYVYYDLTQSVIGSCGTDQIGVALAAPVVDKNADRQELVIYGGGVHLSKESLEMDGRKIFGVPSDLHFDGWSEPLQDCYIRKLSQEHGVICVTPRVFERYSVGDLIGILPVHSCMTMDLMRFNGEIMVI